MELSLKGALSILIRPSQQPDRWHRPPPRTYFGYPGASRATDKRDEFAPLYRFSPD
jgi:hypothetical protein